MANFSQKVSCCRHGFLGMVVERLVQNSSRSTTRRFFSSDSSVVSATALHRSTPWLMLPSEIDPATGGKMDCFYGLTDKQVYKLNRKNSLPGIPEEARCFASTRGLLGFIDPNDCSLYLSNPFLRPVRFRVSKLPSIKTLPSVLSVKHKPTSSSINHSVDQFMIVDHCNDSENHCRNVNPESLSRFIIKHISLSRHPFTYEEEEDTIALVVQGEIPQLAFCEVGKADPAWTTLVGSTTSFAQTVFSRNQDDENLFYSMYADMLGHGIEAWNISGPPFRVPARYASFMYQEHSRHLHEKFKFKKSEQNLRNQCEAKRYLVADKSLGGLLLVIRHTANSVAEDGSVLNQASYEHLQAGPEGCHETIPYKTLRFDVYEVHMMEQKLKRLKFIDDRVIFLGLNQSFVLPASDFPGLRPNSIYFTDDSTATTWDNACPYGGHDMGIYNLEDQSIEPCYPFDDDLKEKKIRPPLLWVAPNHSC